jgi:hypothetical protein
VQALWASVQSLLAAYDVHEKRVCASTFSFVPFLPFQQHRARLTAAISSALSEARYNDAMPMIRELGASAEASLLYLNRYHWRLLYSVVVATYVAWMLLLTCQLVQKSSAFSVIEQSSLAQRAGRLAAAAIVGVGCAAALAIKDLHIPVRSKC